GRPVRHRTRRALAGPVRPRGNPGGADQQRAPGAGPSGRPRPRHALRTGWHPAGRQPDPPVRLAGAARTAAAAPGRTQRHDRARRRLRARGAARRRSHPMIGRLAPPWDRLLLDARLATLRDDLGAYGVIESAALAWKDGLVAFAG